MYKLYQRNLLIVTVAVTAFCSFPVVPVPAQEAAVLEEVVVTARKRSESLQEVPIAVTAFSAADLAMRGAADISEIAQLTPSVTLEPSRATNSTLTAFIRGVGQQDPLAGFEQGVALYLDDVYLARPQGALLDIYDVERVEVLRGPQGTLYGRNAVGGAIKYVTRRLSDEIEFRIKGSLGTYDQRELVASASAPVADLLKIGATVASLERDGYGDNHTTGGDNYNKEVLAYRISAELTPHEDWFIRFAYDRTDDDSDPVGGYRPFPAPLSGLRVQDDIRDTLAGAADNASSAGINGNNSVESEGFHLSAEWQINNSVTIKSISAWREDYTESVIDFDSLPVADFDAPVVYDNEQFSQELQILYTGGRFNAIAGFYYLDASAANDFDVILAQLGMIAFGLPLTAYTGGSVDTEAWSVFADATFDFTDRASISAGGRYTRDKRRADIFRATYFGTGSPFFGNDTAVFLSATSDFESGKTYHDFSPRVNLNYRLSDDANLYVGYSQGWKAGSFDPRGANFSSPEVVDGFEPETLNSYEAGIKATWLDGRVRTNIALFMSDYEDMQIPGSLGIDTDGDGRNDSFVGAVTNAGEAEIQGIEVEAQLLLADNLVAQAAFSKLDADIEEWILNGVDVADQREVQNTPETMAYVGLTYSMEVVKGTLSVNANWSYKDDIVQFETPLPIIDQDAHEIVNAGIVWESAGKNWMVGLYGKNLTDEDVKTAGYCFGVMDCPSALGLEDNTTIFYGPPRTITGTIEYRF